MIYHLCVYDVDLPVFIPSSSLPASFSLASIAKIHLWQKIGSLTRMQECFVMCLPYRLGLQCATVLGMFPLYGVPLLHLDLQGFYPRLSW